MIKRILVYPVQKFHGPFPLKATLYPKLWWIVNELKEVFELEEF